VTVPERIPGQNDSNKRMKNTRNLIIYTLQQVQLEKAYKSGISGRSYQDSLALEDEGMTVLRNVGIC
jgi:hypothetical protein